jgi:hypothetical protein
MRPDSSGAAGSVVSLNLDTQTVAQSVAQRADSCSTGPCQQIRAGRRTTGGTETITYNTVDIRVGLDAEATGDTKVNAPDGLWRSLRLDRDRKHRYRGQKRVSAAHFSSPANSVSPRIAATASVRHRPITARGCVPTGKLGNAPIGRRELADIARPPYSALIPKSYSRAIGRAPSAAVRASACHRFGSTSSPRSCTQVDIACCTAVRRP